MNGPKRGKEREGFLDSPPPKKKKPVDLHLHVLRL